MQIRGEVFRNVYKNTYCTERNKRAVLCSAPRWEQQAIPLEKDPQFRHQDLLQRNSALVILFLILFTTTRTRCSGTCFYQRTQFKKCKK